MKKKITLLMVLGGLLLFTGTAGALLPDPQPQLQFLLPANTIPQFVTPLPVAGDITVVNATTLPLPGIPVVTGAPFPVVAAEFLAQILPPPFPPSSVWGYRIPGVDFAGAPGIPDPTIRQSYLGPVIIAERGVPAYPEYGNWLPLGGFVQGNLPIDMTLDWAGAGLLGSFDCPTPSAVDPVTGVQLPYLNVNCGSIPPYMGPIPIATHLHGGEVEAAYDGGPDAWFTQDGLGQITGSGWPGPVYTYPNEQQEGTIWFHDHALGITRLNVYAGLAGLYPIIDPDNSPGAANGLIDLPQLTDGFDIPLIIQDRTFDTNGQIFYNLASNPQPNPDVHPFWIPEFIGDTIVVNGKTWPFLDVEPRQYRFRFVNGSNARFYELTIKSNDDPVTGALGTKLPFLAIATDDGYLMNAVSTNMIVIGPGERYEVVVDFRGLAPGRFVTMFNSARTPYPGGAKPVNGLTDRVMRFNVVADTTGIPSTNVVAGNPLRKAESPIYPIANAHNPVTGSITRQLTLNEVIGAGGPLELVVNNSKFNKQDIIPGCGGGILCRNTELPAVGDTEIWEIINISADAHPMHTHLTSFQLINRQPFKAAKYIVVYDTAVVNSGKLPGEGPPGIYNVRNDDGAIGGNPAIGPFLKGRPRGPEPYEMGWKDTVIAYPGEVTRIAVRWATTDTPVGGAGEGVNTYPFDPTLVVNGAVGYVWHCHIIDHEDNEMMRNYLVGTLRQPVF